MAETKLTIEERMCVTLWAHNHKPRTLMRTFANCLWFIKFELVCEHGKCCATYDFVERFNCVRVGARPRKEKRLRPPQRSTNPPSAASGSPRLRRNFPEQREKCHRLHCPEQCSNPF